MKIKELLKKHPSLELKALIKESHLDEEDEDIEVTIENGKRLFIPKTDLILAPFEGYDVGDAQINFASVKNLKEIKYLDILGGPSCYVYKKAKVAKPAYLLYHYPEDGSWLLFIIK